VELLLLPLVVVLLESFGVAFTAEFRGASAEATVPAAELPAPVIEPALDQSIVPLLVSHAAEI